LFVIALFNFKRLQKTVDSAPIMKISANSGQHPLLKILAVYKRQTPKNLGGR
jgi:hypothetical protein